MSGLASIPSNVVGDTPPRPGEDPPAAVIDVGAGPAVLLLHGWGATKELMTPVAERLPGYRFIVPDVPGFGATAPPGLNR